MGANDQRTLDGRFDRSSARNPTMSCSGMARTTATRIQAAAGRFQPAAERAGLGRVTWHHFRHIYSSLLNNLRVPVKIAQEQLGHSSISMTLNIYTHVVDASHRKATEALGREVVPTVPKFPDAPKPAIRQLVISV
jgi:integrase